MFRFERSWCADTLQGGCTELAAHMGPEGPSNFIKKTQRFRFSHIFLCCDLDYPTNFQNPPIRAFRDNRILLFSNGVDFHWYVLFSYGFKLSQEAAYYIT